MAADLSFEESMGDGRRSGMKLGGARGAVTRLRATTRGSRANFVAQYGNPTPRIPVNSTSGTYSRLLGADLAGVKGKCGLINMERCKYTPLSLNTPSAIRLATMFIVVVNSMLAPRG
jgi:hypothetical protein